MDKRATAVKIKELVVAGGDVAELCDEHGLTVAQYYYYNKKSNDKPGKRTKVPVVLKSPATFISGHVPEAAAGKALVIVVPMADLNLLLRGIL